MMNIKMIAMEYTGIERPTNDTGKPDRQKSDWTIIARGPRTNRRVYFSISSRKRQEIGKCQRR